MDQSDELTDLHCWGQWPGLQTTKHFCGDEESRGVSQQQCFKKFHPKVRNHGEGPCPY